MPETNAQGARASARSFALDVWWLLFRRGLRLVVSDRGARLERHLR